MQVLQKAGTNCMGMYVQIAGLSNSSVYKQSMNMPDLEEILNSFQNHQLDRLPPPSTECT